MRVVKASQSAYWYSNRIGQEFEVSDEIYVKKSGIKSYRLKDEVTHLIDVVDTVEIDRERVIFT